MDDNKFYKTFLKLDKWVKAHIASVISKYKKNKENK